MPGPTGYLCPQCGAVEITDGYEYWCDECNYFNNCPSGITEWKGE